MCLNVALQSVQISDKRIISQRTKFAIGKFSSGSEKNSFRQIKYGLKYKYFDLILFCGSGLIGLLIIYLWGFTDHLSKNNFNILWAFPINFILPFLFSRERHKKWFIIYVIFYIAVLISLLILWNFIPQNLNQNVLIITLSMILRLASNIIYINRNEIIYN